jgi:hypothetical protein
LAVELVELLRELAGLGRPVVVGLLNLLAQLGALVGVELAAAGDAVGDRPTQRLALGLPLALLGPLGPSESDVWAPLPRSTSSARPR